MISKKNWDFKLSKTCDGYSVAFWMLRDSNGFLDFGVDFWIFSTFLKHFWYAAWAGWSILVRISEILTKIENPYQNRSSGPRRTPKVLKKC